MTIGRISENVGMQIKTTPQFQVNNACFHGEVAANFSRNKKNEKGSSTVTLHSANAVIYFASGFTASSTRWGYRHQNVAVAGISESDQ